MEKTLNMGAFEALDHQEMMEVDGGYTFLCDKNTNYGTAKDFYDFASGAVDVISKIWKYL